MLNDYEQNIMEMQDQIKELSLLLLNDWQNLEIHDVEEKVFRLLLTVGKRALSA